MTAYLNGIPHDFSLIDLSPRGALVRRNGSRRGPPIVHRLRFRLVNGAMVRAVARTVWSNEKLHAVSFVEMTDIDRLEIAEMIDGFEQKLTGELACGDVN